MDFTEETQTLSIDVTDAQKEAIEMLFSQNGWELNFNAEGSNTEESDGSNSESNDGEDINNDMEGYPPGLIIPQDMNAAESPDCYCKPCILDGSNGQAWWPQEAQPPSVQNSCIRKYLCRWFYTMLYNTLA